MKTKSMREIRESITNDLFSLPISVHHGESDNDKEHDYDETVSEPYYTQRYDQRNWKTETHDDSVQAAVRRLAELHRDLIDKGWECNVNGGQNWSYSAGGFHVGWWDTISIYINKQLAAAIVDLKAKSPDVIPDEDAPVIWV